MTKRKPRRKTAAASRKGGLGQVGWVWWTAGALAVGWIAFDANRAAIERHVPQLARLARPGGEAEIPRRAAAPERQPTRAAPPVRQAPSTPAPARVPAAVPKAPVPKATVPEERPVRTAAIAPAAPQPRPMAAATPSPARETEAVRIVSGSALATRQPMPLRREPSAGAPVWMVLDAGRPLRVTRRQGDWALVQSGIFTGWVAASAVAAPRPVGTVMPALAAARSGRGGPVPEAAIPGTR
ncbi:SH3 domain-containing protein [Aureimonas sp. ME7]|uniref:SH3 domain-containing protein n=1 Tax=Aureimonas sp. ME7 TaxID=2744252 RepID=UPI0015F53CC2|nr:SH3 domain-containing protein [Aureimonas sp. ME7]